MIEGPWRAPSSPPEMPVPIKKIPRSLRNFSRRSVSEKWLLPPSMTISPLSRKRMSWSINSSTGAPAFTINITLRGRFKRRKNSSRECAPATFVPLAGPCKKSSTLLTVRLNTATQKPFSSIFKTRFWPITARPMSPISATSFSMALSPFFVMISTLHRDCRAD